MVNKKVGLEGQNEKNMRFTRNVHINIRNFDRCQMLIEAYFMNLSKTKLNSNLLITEKKETKMFKRGDGYRIRLDGVHFSCE